MFNTIGLGWIRRHHPYGMLHHPRGPNHAQAGASGEDEGRPHFRDEEAPRAASEHSRRPRGSELRAVRIRAGAFIHFGTVQVGSR